MSTVAKDSKPFDDTDDFLQDFMGGEILPPEEINMKIHKGKPQVVDVPLVHTEKCPACGGTGQFRSYSGRVVGNCFKCKGKGSKTFKSSPTQRADAKAKREAKKETAFETFSQSFPAEAAWIQKSAATGFEFAVNMINAIKTYGDLTHGQLAAVQRLTVKDATRTADRAKERQDRIENAPSVSVVALETAFKAALSNGIDRPKINLDTFRFKLAGSTSVNRGAIYVLDRESRVYLGKIADGKFMSSRDCTPEQSARIVIVASDPHAAAIAYGRRTGRCSCCGRGLTNHASIDAGIGPICAEKMGW